MPPPWYGMSSALGLFLCLLSSSHPCRTLFLSKVISLYSFHPSLCLGSISDSPSQQGLWEKVVKEWFSLLADWSNGSRRAFDSKNEGWNVQMRL